VIGAEEPTVFEQHKEVGHNTSSFLQEFWNGLGHLGQNSSPNPMCTTTIPVEEQAREVRVSVEFLQMTVSTLGESCKLPPLLFESLLLISGK